MDGLEEDFRSLFGFQLDSRSPDLELFKAAYAGNLHDFKRLALNHAEKKGVGLGKAIGKLIDERGRGSLHFAAEGGRLNVCIYLLEKLKLDVDSKDNCGKTPLLNAIRGGHLDTVRYLLEKGANVDASDDLDFTPLQCAATMGDAKIIALLLSKGVHVNVATRIGTALQIAAYSDRRDVVKMLLDHGANVSWVILVVLNSCLSPNVVACQGMLRPLISAIFGKSWDCVELLLQAGADPNAVSCGNTPLVIAAKDEHADVITRLLEAGADPNYKNN
ncbi:hypothetical protein MKW94_016701, partial [Papaver nudicaule]|nr:hypothetical protein [Papaver nudicaule]